MQIGIVATYFKKEGFVPGVVDLDDKWRHISKNKWKYLMIDQLVGWIDHEHLETIGFLHWLRNLCEFVPELSDYKSHVSTLFHTCGAKHQLPVHATTVHPLVMSRMNETITTELKDALLDFFRQIGQI